MRSQKANWVVIGLLVIAVLGMGALLVVRLSAAPEKLPPPPPMVVLQSPDPRREVIGTSVQGRTIEAFTFGRGATHLVLVGGIHGGYEWNSVLLAYTYLDYLSANPTTLPKSMSVTVIPDINPDAVFAATGKDGRFTVEDVSTSTKILTAARFNAHNVDLNRNFDCKWQPKSTWQSKVVSGGTVAFSEPEAAALRDYVASVHPAALVFWHSKANAVFASQCKDGILPVTLEIMKAYSEAAKYPAVKSFDAYPTTGAADDWLASIGVPAVTVELQSHDSIEWDRNLLGITSLIEYLAHRSVISAPPTQQ